MYPEEFDDELDSDMSWRKKEISVLYMLAQKKDDEG